MLNSLSEDSIVIPVCQEFFSPGSKKHAAVQLLLRILQPEQEFPDIAADSADIVDLETAMLYFDAHPKSGQTALYGLSFRLSENAA